LSTRFSIALALAGLLLAVGLLTVPVAGMRLGSPHPESADSNPATIAAVIGGAESIDPAAKLSDGLAELARTGNSTRKVHVVVQSVRALDLAAFSDAAHQFTWPAGEHVAVLEVAAKDTLAIAALPGVYQVDWADADAPVDLPEGAIDKPAVDPAALRAQAAVAPSWWETKAKLDAAKEAGIDPARAAATSAGGADPAAEASGDADASGGGRTDGWFDVRGGHAAKEAWDLGYRGDGVRVAVLDYAIDFAHQDLQGTWAVLPPGHPYAGWPQMFDPVAGYRRVLDKPLAPERHSTRLATNGMVELYQDSDVVEREINGEVRLTGCFKPLQLVQVGALGVVQLGAEACDYILPPTSESGKVRFGHHPDPFLPALGAKEGILGEYAGVLLVDAETDGPTNGEYNTVYVDVDNDRDFTDEKPVTREDPAIWRDVDGDAIADLSGGLLYFIADGELQFPGSWVWGLDTPADIPAAGRFIGIHYANGDHGTLCGSNIVAQGRLNVPAGRDLKFRDLPGNHEPPGVNHGLAPEGDLVSIGSVYAFGRAMFAPAWRYAVFGHDIQRDDDQLQVTSNSYGFSDADNDTWDPDSRLLDYYVQTYAPSTSFLFSTGNGAPGYGTLAPPSPSVGMDIGASTQFGSTGADSITDTTQITFGDIIPFSNRGPGASGQHGPEVAADGAYAAGAIPLNFVSNGTLANGTWGGTSRSSPVAAGAMTLVYDAFKKANNRWPTWREARSILMSGARFNGYDIFTVGGGVVDAGDSVRIAAGLHGVYAIPSEWTAGSYRGGKHPAFAKLLAPGESDTQTITLKNPTDKPLAVTLSAKTLRKIGSYDDALVTDRTKETTVGPDYLVPLDERRIPAGTELMIVRGRFPYGEFDVGSDLVADNYYTPGVMQHTDINGDGKLWEDKNSNGVVNNKSIGPLYVKFDWDSQSREDDALQGAFTRQLTAEGLSAEIAWYGLGCNDETGAPPDPEQEVNEKIALIERGGRDGTCTFFEKFTNAMNAGAIAAVVFTDERPVVTMGSTLGNVDIPGVMIEREAGLAVKAALEGGADMTAAMIFRTNITLKGLGGAAPVRYDASDIQQYEYMTMNSENGLKNHWAIPVHHPRERWSDGLYMYLTHSGRSAVVTNTHIAMRVDSYAYRDWTALSLSQTAVTIPPKGEVTVDATLRVGADSPYGGLQGAIFVDYPRGAGDLPVAAPGGFELPGQRTVIPVNTTVGASYGWKGSVTLGGAKADDRDAPYNNGAVQGTFKWNWRPESGDWRFFFIDIAEKAVPGTFMLLRTTWQDSAEKQSDIDTRVYGPVVDRFSDPEHPANKPNPTAPAVPVENMGNPAWYGPYTLNLLARSPYLVTGSVWPFNTTTGKNEDWLALIPGAEGLHEVMLHNVLFSGSQFDMPFETTVSSIRVASRTSTNAGVPAQPGGDLTLIRAQCSQLEITSEMDMPSFSMRAYGMSVPQVTRGLTVTQDVAASIPSAGFKRDIKLDAEAGRFSVSTTGKPTDDIDLYILFDANKDGTFAYPQEAVANSGNQFAEELATVPGLAAAGDYQIWVHGYALGGATQTTFDMTVDIVSGSTIQLKNAPTSLTAGQTAVVEVCADQASLEGQNGPAYGMVTFGPESMPVLFQIPVTWWRSLPMSIWLPAQLNNEVLGEMMP
jgi:hypothetical protein